MRLRTRIDEESPRSQASVPIDDAAARQHLLGVRNEGQGLFEAVDEAIVDVLSDDSQEFLRRSQQEGGE